MKLFTTLKSIDATLKGIYKILKDLYEVADTAERRLAPMYGSLMRMEDFLSILVQASFRRDTEKEDAMDAEQEVPTTEEETAPLLLFNAVDAKGKKWTSQDEDQLCKMYNDNASYDEMAKALGRTKEAIYGRVKYLRISNRKPHRKDE